jgi:hypothetical protein
MLPLNDVHDLYPLSWKEQVTWLQALPDHLARMYLFEIHTGYRER